MARRSGRSRRRRARNGGGRSGPRDSEPARPGVRVALLNRQRRRPVDGRRLRRVVEGAAGALRASGEVALLLTGDRVIRALNARFRGKDRPTDVLSFPGPGGEAGLGDIVISVETAARNARRLGRTVPGELDVLALHGFLHLLGYDHETDHGEMDRLEGRLRRRLLRAPAADRRRRGAAR